MSVGVRGFVNEAEVRRKGFGPDGLQPPARGEGFKEFVTGVKGIGHNLSQPPQRPRVVQVLEKWQIADIHLLSRVDNMP